MQTLFMLLMLLTATFLILLVLVQRGRGGGLTGALGGMGGQSAFGSKAGDLFTRITIGVAAFWIILSVASIKVLNTPDNVFGETDQTDFGSSNVPSLTTDPPEGVSTDGPELTDESDDVSDLTGAADAEVATEDEASALGDAADSTDDAATSTPAEPATEAAPTTEDAADAPAEEAPASDEATSEKSE